MSASNWSQLVAPHGAQSTSDRATQLRMGSSDRHHRSERPAFQSPVATAHASARRKSRAKLHMGDAEPAETHPREKRPTTPEQPSDFSPDGRFARGKKAREPQHIASNLKKHTPFDQPAVHERPRDQSRRASANATQKEHAGRVAPRKTRTSMSEAESHREPHAAKHGKGRKRVYCGNNALAEELASGQAVLGTRSECFRKGVGGGLHATVPPGGRQEFIKKWTAPYRKLVDQPLHYGDGPAPQGKFPATLSQCLARGFAVGSVQKAKQMLGASRRGAETDPSGPATRAKS